MCGNNQNNICSYMYSGIYIYIYMFMCLVTQLCLTLCNPMDCSPPGSSVHGIFQARILEWVAIFPFKGSSWTRYWTLISCISYIAGSVCWAIREIHMCWYSLLNFQRCQIPLLLVLKQLKRTTIAYTLRSLKIIVYTLPLTI